MKVKMYDILNLFVGLKEDNGGINTNGISIIDKLMLTKFNSVNQAKQVLEFIEQCNKYRELIQKIDENEKEKAIVEEVEIQGLTEDIIDFFTVPYEILQIKKFIA